MYKWRTGWNYPDAGKSHVINHTFNPDANAQCATGHFRVAEDIERRPEMLLKNSSGKLAITAYGHCHVYDHTQAAVQKYWRDNCLAVANAGLDGCGADFSAGGVNSMVANTVENTMAFMNLTRETAVAWRAGRRQMMIDTTAALGNGLLIGKDPNELGDHVNAVVEEDGCMRRNASVNGLRKLAARRKAAGAAGAAWIYQCHAPDFSNSTLAVFLAGASDGDYLTVGGWVKSPPSVRSRTMVGCSVRPHGTRADGVPHHHPLARPQLCHLLFMLTCLQTKY